LPFLPNRVKFAEPCFGEGILAADLEINGHEAVWRSDITPYGGGRSVEVMNAFDLTSQELNSADMVISNPPWSRQILHPLIKHLSALKPTWLLFDTDWAFTKQSAEIMQTLCTDIVAVGRLIWIPGTKVSGKDNTSWYRFDINKNRDTIFHGREYIR
jgi:hypothetical protein